MDDTKEYDQMRTSEQTREPALESAATGIGMAQRVDRAADAARSADVLVKTWQRIELALTPILGRGSVDALFVRSLHLAAHQHPWLKAVHADADGKMNLDSLQSHFSRQSIMDAAQGGDAMVQRFHDILESLVGLPLTTRLLRPVWATAWNAAATEDPSA